MNKLYCILIARKISLLSDIIDRIFFHSLISLNKIKGKISVKKLTSLITLRVISVMKFSKKLWRKTSPLHFPGSYESKFEWQKETISQLEFSNFGEKRAESVIA